MIPPDGVPGFIRANTEIVVPPLLPEIRLRLATELTPIWQATEAELETQGLPPPFWAFCWPGGQAIARYILDNPGLVRGRNVLDFASGCGVAAIAAAMAGANRVVANDIDGFALRAAAMNAERNGVEIELCGDNVLAGERQEVVLESDLILAGDIFYDRPVAADVEAFLRSRSRNGVTVLVGDPGRKYLPRDHMREIARYRVPTSLEIERDEILDGVVWEFSPD